MPSPVDLKWTKTELAILRSNMNSSSIEELIILLPKRNVNSIERKIKKIFTEETILKYIEEIKEKYLSGVSVLKLSKEYKISDRNIRKALVELNVDIRNNPSGNLARSGKNNACWTGHEDISGSFFRCLKRDADRREIPCLVTIEDIWNLFLLQDKKCAISGIELTFGDIISNRTASLDRIDSKKFYEIGNIQFVHKTINIMKNNLSDEDFIGWCKIITNHQMSKSILIQQDETAKVSLK